MFVKYLDTNFSYSVESLWRTRIGRIIFSNDLTSYNYTVELSRDISILFLIFEPGA